MELRTAAGKDAVLHQMVFDVGVGRTHPTQAVDMASAMVKDGRASAAVASVAACGRQRHKAEDAFHKRVSELLDVALEPFPFSVPAWDETLVYKSTLELQAILPWELLGEMRKSPGAFERCMLGKNGLHAPAMYWANVSRGTFKHHVVSDPAYIPYQASIFPYTIHEDGIEVFADQEFNLYQFASALTDGSKHPWDLRYILLCVEKARKYFFETDDEIFRFLSWVDQVLESGYHPRVDHNNRPMQGRRAALAGKLFADGWMASMVYSAGDLKEKVETHRFNRNYLCMYMCERCLGTKSSGPLNAMDFSASAPWKNTQVTHEQYLATTPPSRLSPYTRFRSWTIHRHRFDDLHQIWLGFGKDVAGQLLYDCAAHYGATGNFERDLKLLYVDCKEHYRGRGGLSVKCFSSRTLSLEKGWPTLFQRLKGARSKRIFLWIAPKIIDIVQSGRDVSDYSVLRATMTWGLYNWVLFLDSCEMFLTDAQAAIAQMYGWTFLRAYSQLASIAVAQGMLAYKIRPKLHYFAHVALELDWTFENPNRQDLTMAEDYMGKFKKVGLKVHKQRFHLRVAQRLILVMSLRWRCPAANVVDAA